MKDASGDPREMTSLTRRDRPSSRSPVPASGLLRAEVSSPDAPTVGPPPPGETGRTPAPLAGDIPHGAARTVAADGTAPPPSQAEQANELYQRIAANCCQIHGFTEKQYREHVAAIVAVVDEAKAKPRYPGFCRHADLEPTVYLGHAMIVRAKAVDVFDPDTGEFSTSFRGISAARRYVQARRKEPS